MMSKSTYPYSSGSVYLPGSDFSDVPGLKLKRTNSTYSLHSEFSHLSSSTLTLSDNPGPGRLLDKFVFQKGGRLLEHKISRLAYVAGYGPIAIAQRIGNNLKGFSLGDEESANDEEKVSVDGHSQLRLDLGLIQDVDRLRSDCKKLFEYSLSGSLQKRIQALKMIITLFVRFPYLTYYFDSPELQNQLRFSGMNSMPSQSSFASRESTNLLHGLSRMAYSCIFSEDRAVARLVDHLAERTKFAEIIRRGGSTGPQPILLPERDMIYSCCTSPTTSFSAIRFTSIIFHRSFLTCGQDFYLKLNSLTLKFWQCLIDCVEYLLQVNGEDSKDSDSEGTELFSGTVLEMLYRAVSWDEEFKTQAVYSDLVDRIVAYFRTPYAQAFLPNSTFTALAVLKPKYNEIRDAYLQKKPTSSARVSDKEYETALDVTKLGGDDRELTSSTITFSRIELEESDVDE